MGLRDTIRGRNREHVLNMVRQDGMFLGKVSKKLRDDEEIVREALKNNRHSLQYASSRLRDNAEFMLEAVRTVENLDVMEYIGPGLRNDKKFVMDELSRENFRLRWASDELRADREVVMAAVKWDANDLQYASPELRDDKEVALVAAQAGFGNALGYVSSRLFYDKDVILAAVSQHESALNNFGYTLPSLLQVWSRDFKIELLKANPNILRRLGNDFKEELLKESRDFKLDLVKSHPRMLDILDDECKSDKEFVLAALKQKSGSYLAADCDEKEESTLRYVSTEMLDDIVRNSKENPDEFEVVANALYGELLSLFDHVECYRKWSVPSSQVKEEEVKAQRVMEVLKRLSRVEPKIIKKLGCEKSQCKDEDFETVWTSGRHIGEETFRNQELYYYETHFVRETMTGFVEAVIQAERDAVESGEIDVSGLRNKAQEKNAKAKKVETLKGEAKKAEQLYSEASVALEDAKKRMTDKKIEGHGGIGE